MKSEKGISLVELLMVVVAVFFLALLINNLPSSISSINKNRHLSQAKDIASKQLDSLRKVTYANLANGTNSFTDTSLMALPSSSASYTIEDCPVDICPDNEQVKKATVQITWRERENNQSVSLVTLVGAGGVGQ